MKYLWPTLCCYFWGPALNDGDKKIKSMSFHQYSWNSEVETTWISLIGWYHNTSSTYSPNLDFLFQYQKTNSSMTLQVVQKLDNFYYFLDMLSKALFSWISINLIQNPLIVSWKSTWLGPMLNSKWSECFKLKHVSLFLNFDSLMFTLSYRKLGKLHISRELQHSIDL